MKQKYFLFALTLVLISLASASFSLSNYTLQENYIKGTDLISTLNISFSNEPLTNVFTDSLLNSITLEEVLNNSPSYSHTCSFQNCAPDYTGTNSELSKSFTLAPNQTKLIGIVLNGTIQNIDSLAFSMTSDAVESDKNQIKIDILNDGVIETGNTNVGSGTGEENYGCFSESESFSEIAFTTLPFCQKVSLNETPGLWMGAWVKEQTTGANSILMELYSKEGTALKNCTLSKASINSSGGEVFCEVEILITEPKEYYVCATKEAGLGGYKALGYSGSNNCGFQGVPVKSEIATYKIGVKQKNFGTVGSINIQNTLPSGNKTSDLISNYIISNYLGNCTNGCYIPINVISSANQGILLSGLNLVYDQPALPNKVESNYYDFEEISSRVSSGYGLLNLNNLFSLKNSEGEITYSLKLNSQELFEKDLDVKNIPITIGPDKAIAGVPTTFKVTVNGDLNVSLYEWDFGNGSKIVTTSPTVSYTYFGLKNQTLNLALTTKIGKFSFSKEILVGSAKDILTKSLDRAKISISDLKKEALTFSTFEANELSKIINLDNLSLKLTALETEKTAAVSDANYTRIYNKFLNINFPTSFRKIPVGSAFYLPEQSSINLNALSTITDKNYSNAQATFDYIKFWNKQNLDSQLSSNKLSVTFEDGTVSELSLFEISIDQRDTISEDYYFLLKDSQNINLENPTKFKKSGSYTYLKLANSKETIRYSIMGVISATELPFISPSLLQEDFVEIPISPEPVSTTWIIIFILIALILIVFTVYLVLNRWYKVKYEKYLFPNKNQLYNAITYVNNSLNAEMEETQISQNLIKAGWKKEQVSYIMKKYAGKNIGMPGLSSKPKVSPQVSPQSSFQENPPTKPRVNPKSKTGIKR